MRRKSDDVDEGPPTERTVDGPAHHGLDAVALARCLEDSIGHRIVRADIAEADALGLSSTPSFFINGHYIGSLPKEGLNTLIENELAASGR